jgi:hypothetical protein
MYYGKQRLSVVKKALFRRSTPLTIVLRKIGKRERRKEKSGKNQKRICATKQLCEWERTRNEDMENLY